MTAWIQLHSTGILAAMGVLGVVTFVASLLALPMLVSRLPGDYFSRSRSVDPPWRSEHPTRSTMICLGRNLLGIVLVLGGVCMLFLPGQGLLTLAIGLLLMDFPRKRAFQAWVLSWKPVHRGLNWLRRKADKPEFSFS